MDNQKLIAEWQAKIIERCETKLGRLLFPTELHAIKQFRGFQALEMIDDTVTQAQPNEIEHYLISLVA
jgi:hypothetical protein